MILKARLRHNILKVYLPLQNPKVSNSGKNLTIASSNGPASTGIEYEGRPVRIVINAFVPNSEHQTERTKQEGTKTSNAKSAKQYPSDKEIPPLRSHGKTVLSRRGKAKKQF